MSQSRFSKSTQAPARLQRLELPERAPIAGTSARRADIALLAKAPPDFLDTTHFDTVRFPPPPWAAEQFARAADDGALAYTGYRGNGEVLSVLAGSVGGFLDLPLDSQQHLILTPGTQAGLFASLASLIEEGDRVALIDPDYLFSARILRFFGRRYRACPTALHGGRTVPGFRCAGDGIQAQRRALSGFLAPEQSDRGGVLGRSHCADRPACEYL